MGDAPTVRDWEELARKELKGDPESLVWATPEGIPVKPLYTAADLEGIESRQFAAGVRSLPPGRAGHDVLQPAVDDPAIRGVLHRRGLERVLPGQPRRRPDGALGRVRPRDAPGLRQRPPAGRRRRREGRRRHRLGRGHEDPLRRDPARQDERLDDHERRGAAGDGRLHRRRRGAGRRRGAALGDAPERHPQRVHGPEHLHLSAGAEPADRRPTSSSTRPAACRGSTRSRSPAITCRKPARPRCRSSASPWPTASSTRAPRSSAASTSTTSRPPLVLLRHRHEPLHGGGQAARRAPVVGARASSSSTRRSRRRSCSARTARRPACRSPSTTPTTTSCAPRSKRWPRCSAAPRACTPTRSTKRSRCRASSPRASPATRSSSSPRSRASPTSSTRWAAATTSRRSPTASPKRRGS